MRALIAVMMAVFVLVLLGGCSNERAEGLYSELAQCQDSLIEAKKREFARESELNKITTLSDDLRKVCAKNLEGLSKHKPLVLSCISSVDLVGSICSSTSDNADEKVCVDNAQCRAAYAALLED